MKRADITQSCKKSKWSLIISCQIRTPLERNKNDLFCHPSFRLLSHQWEDASAQLSKEEVGGGERLRV